MTPNKLPPLPEPEFIRPDRPFKIFTADQMLAYGKLCSAEAFQLYVDANEARIDAEKALRQSQSLPAGAVAGLVDRLESTAAAYPKDVFLPLTVAQRAKHGDIIQAASAGMGRFLSPLLIEAANTIKALQADAREKGEAGHKPVAFRWLRNGLPVCSWTDGVPPETAMQRADDLKGYADWQVEYAYSSLATQPAQASEKDECVSVPRDALLTEARRLRYRATETYGLGPANTDAGAQMIHTAESLEGFASSQHGESKP